MAYSHHKVYMEIKIHVFENYLFTWENIPI